MHVLVSYHSLPSLPILSFWPHSLPENTDSLVLRLRLGSAFGAQGGRRAWNGYLAPASSLGCPGWLCCSHWVTEPSHSTVAGPGYCILPGLLLCPAHTFVSSPFIKVNSNDSCYVCHLFSVRALTDTVFSTYVKTKMHVGGGHGGTCTYIRLEHLRKPAQKLLTVVPLGSGGLGSRRKGYSLLLYNFYSFWILYYMHVLLTK